MPFKTDKQRKAFFAKQGNLKSPVKPQVIEIRKRIEVPKDLTIADVKSINAQAGFKFFTPESMRFFASRIETKGELIKNKFFITSEKKGFTDERRGFTVREFVKSRGDINTVGTFGGFSTKAKAIAFAEKQN